MNRCQFLWSVALLGCAVAASSAVAQESAERATQAGSLSGAQVYARWCADCHSTPTGPGSMALERRLQGRVPAVLDQRTDLNPAYVAAVVRRGISFMPSFRKTEISDAELARMVDYLVAGQAPQGRANARAGSQ